MSRTVGIACMVALAAASLSAQEKPTKPTGEEKPLSGESVTAKPPVYSCSPLGTWKLNTALTHWYKEKPDKSVEFTVTRADESEIAWNATITGFKGEVDHVSYAGPNDGKDHPFGPYGNTAAYTNAGDEQIATYKDPHGNVTGRNRSRFSSDCNTWTINVFRIDDRGEELLVKTEVFERKPSS
jgi:hypothetical protein